MHPELEHADLAWTPLHGSPSQVYHVLNNPPEGWTQGSGFITVGDGKRTGHGD